MSFSLIEILSKRSMKNSNIILHALTSLKIKGSSINNILNDRAKKIKTKSNRHISGKKGSSLIRLWTCPVVEKK